VFLIGWGDFFRAFASALSIYVTAYQRRRRIFHDMFHHACYQIREIHLVTRFSMVVYRPNSVRMHQIPFYAFTSATTLPSESL
jgi:hypothetical protein